ncbi:MAG TPA: dTDP-4-dehydrorhamnose 3,5-epimerase [Tepidisphaeraceae bacterium]|nr:dTDP-4-dehydrorhamnose 3,5-epimerase [Tepidisphaeraceae bacterium]
MIYTPTKLHGAVILEIEPIRDDRGFFSYLFDAKDAAAHGLRVGLAQVKVSYNHRAGTLRGMHYQCPPSAEMKLVRCTRGAILDVIVDLREDSPTYLQHISVELTADNHKSLYVPQMFAHGYQTLVDNTEVVYQVDEFYAPQHERGLKFDDPKLGIKWPLPPSGISRRDESWALLQTD